MGQRTTLDVLNSQQDLVNARVALVTAQPGGGVLHGAGGDRRAVVASPRAQDRGLRSGHALPAGARRLGRRAHARRALMRNPAAYSPNGGLT